MQSRVGERLSSPLLPTPLEQARVIIVLGAYNEAACIGDIVRELREHYPHVVVVDDGSHDETGELAMEAGACVLTHLINRGQGAALQTGLTYALAQGADYIVTLDVDAQYDVKDIEPLLLPIAQGKVHATLGSRYSGHTLRLSFVRRAERLADSLVSRLTARARPTDAHNGMRALSRHAAQLIELKKDRAQHASELVDQVVSAGLPYLEVPVQTRLSEYGLSKAQRSSAALRVAFQYIKTRLIR